MITISVKLFMKFIFVEDMKLAQKIAIGYVRATLNMIAVVSPKKAAEKAYELFCTPQYRSNKPFPDIFAKGEKLYFTQQGKKVRGYRWNKDAGNRLLILHGYESSCRKFDHHISRAVKAGFEVLAFDAPAHGSSEGSQVTLLDYMEMISNTEKHFGKIDRFICHSFGGFALMMYLEKRSHDATTRAVVIAPASETTVAIDGFFGFMQLSNKVRKEFDRIIHQKSGHWPAYFSASRALKHITASILWIHDEEDLVTPVAEAQKVMATGYPNIEFMITKGLGHNKIYRDNDVKRKIFSFL
jgi:pimeloyl-ACP methyl ester carboxylesterase